MLTSRALRKGHREGCVVQRGAVVTTRVHTKLNAHRPPGDHPRGTRDLHAGRTPHPGCRTRWPGLDERRTRQGPRQWRHRSGHVEGCDRRGKGCVCQGTAYLPVNGRALSWMACAGQSLWWACTVLVAPSYVHHREGRVERCSDLHTAHADTPYTYSHEAHAVAHATSYQSSLGECGTPILHSAIWWHERCCKHRRATVQTHAD